MTSRERVMAAINHQETDRVPIDLGGSRVSGIHVKAYLALREYLGIQGPPPRVFDMMQMLAIVEEPVLERLGVDVIPLHRKEIIWGMGTENWRPWKLWDGTEVQVPAEFDPKTCDDGSLLLHYNGQPAARMPHGGAFFDSVPEAVAKKVSPEEYNPPLLTDEDLQWMQKQAQNLYNSTSRAILGGLYIGNLFEMYLGGFEEWMIALQVEPEYIQAIYEKTAENWIENLRLYNEAVGEYIFAVVFCDDLGHQGSEWMRRDLFEERVAPYYARIFGWLHENTDLQVFLHSCGSIRNLIPVLIEAGVDILNPVQCSAANMDPAELKAEFGDRLTFWGGGIDTQQVLPFASPEKVAADTRERLEIFAPGGGYVFNTTHNILAEVPPENLAAMYETVHQYGKYPIGSG